jgi:hypothetical protein
VTAAKKDSFLYPHAPRSPQDSLPPHLIFRLSTPAKMLNSILAAALLGAAVKAQGSTKYPGPEGVPFPETTYPGYENDIASAGAQFGQTSPPKYPSPWYLLSSSHFLGHILSTIGSTAQGPALDGRQPSQRRKTLLASLRF